MKTRVSLLSLAILLAAFMALPAIAQNQSSGVDNPPDISVPGNWTLHYDWACVGKYGTAAMTFNAGGTFSSPPYVGHWSQHDGQIVWRFDTGFETTYEGSAIDNAMVGISTTFAGTNGCWYALRVGTGGVETKGEFDASGNKNE